MKAHKQIKRWLIAALLASTLAFAYFLFEPVASWPLGWRNLPAETLDSVGESKTYRTEYAPKIARAQALLAQAQLELNAPAISVAVGVDGELVWAEARGLADVDTRQPAKLDSRFRLGSTSKTVTATAIGKLMETGLLDIDAPIQRYAKYFPQKSHPITTRQVLSHTAGFRDYKLCLCFPVWEYNSTTQFANFQHSLDLLANDPLEAKPGGRFKYTSPGFNVAGAIAEGASGRPFSDFLVETLFVPLDMRNTSLDYGDRAVAGRVEFYHVKGKTYKPAFKVNNSGKWASGGIVSTPSDLVRMGNAIMSGRYLRADIRDQLFTPQKLSDGAVNAQKYALGWRNQPRKMFGDTATLTTVHHGGLAVGSTSFLVLFPDQKVVVSILMNLDSEGVMKLHTPSFAIAEIFLADEVQKMQKMQKNQPASIR